MIERTPIALFIYNRPDHTARTIAALATNPVARESNLIIFADGPKRPDHRDTVAAARAVARQAAGFKSVRIVERDRNFGLANSIIAGVSETCEAYGRAIVVEDDLVVAPGFLEFLNAALDRYADDAQVMQVSGYMFPVKRAESLPDCFFSRLPTSWGWATWRRAWQRFESNAARLLEQIDRQGARAFDLDGAFPYREMLEQNSRGVLDVWGARWYASMFLHEGLCLYPARSLVNNIGMDGSGEHCTPSTAYDVVLSSGVPRLWPPAVEPSVAGEAAIRSFLHDRTRPSFRSVAARLRNYIRKSGGA